MSFGETVKRLRKEKGMTQDQLANLLNVTPQAISRWETNSAMPDISQLVPLANVFRVSTDTLLEVNVEETEKQIGEIIKKTGFALLQNEDLEEKAGILREGIRRFPQDKQLKDLLLAILAEQDLNSRPDTDPVLIREQISLVEDLIELSTDRTEIGNHISMLSSLNARLSNSEKIREIAGDASPLRSSREVLLPASLQGEEQVRARKDLIFQCTDILISTIHELYEENAADLTEEEWQELCRARNVVETVYGKSFSDHYVLEEQMYSRVHGAVVRGNTEEAVASLEEIVRRLKQKEKGTVEDSSLVVDTQYMCLWMIAGFTDTVSRDAGLVMSRLKKDFEIDGMRKSNPRFNAAFTELERLSESRNAEFDEYCINGFVDLLTKEILERKKLEGMMCS